MVKPGNESSEWLAGKRLVYLGLAVAVVTSVFELPITPEWFQAKMIIITQSAKEWTKVLTVPILGIYATYTASRTFIKKNNE